MGSNSIDNGTQQPAPELLEELARASASLESAEPPEIIRWAAERFGDRLTMATAFGPEEIGRAHV